MIFFRLLKKHGRTLVVTLGTVLLCALLLRKIQLTELKNALARSNPLWVALAALIATCLNLFGTLRMSTLLKALSHHLEPPSFWRQTWILFGAATAHNFLPAPAGEIYRTAALKQRGYSVSLLVAEQLVEKLVEALGLTLGTLAVVASGYLPLAVARVLTAVSLAGILLLIALAAFGRRLKSVDHPVNRRQQITKFVAHLSQVVQELRSPFLLGRALFWSIATDVGNALSLGLCALAVGANLPVAGWFVGMLAARSVGLIPTTPGQFGVQEAGVGAALVALGLAPPMAAAVAILHHAVHFIPITLIGSIELKRNFSPPVADKPVDQ